MEIKVHCKNCHTEWDIPKNLEDVLDVDDGDYTMSAFYLYVCPNCHQEIECTVYFDKVPRSIKYY